MGQGSVSDAPRTVLLYTTNVHQNLWIGHCVSNVCPLECDSTPAFRGSGCTHGFCLKGFRRLPNRLTFAIAGLISSKTWSSEHLDSLK